MLQIRFFERVKLERRIKQLEREAKSVDPSTTAPINTWLAQTREDLQVSFTSPLTLSLLPVHPASGHVTLGPSVVVGYTIGNILALLKFLGMTTLQYVVNYPKGEKYVSLLRNTEDPEAQKALEAERKRIRAKVKQQLADIAMITQPDEGNPQVLKQPAQPLASPATSQVSMQPHCSGQGQSDCISQSPCKWAVRAAFCWPIVHSPHTCRVCDR